MVLKRFLLRPNPRISDFSPLLLGSAPMSWSCKKCTFLNSPSQNSACKICLSCPSSPPKWSCKACTFVNPYKNPTCEICSTRAPVSLISTLEELNDTSLGEESGSTVGSVFLPLRRCNKRKISELDTGAAEDDCVDSSRVQPVLRPVDIKEGTSSGNASDSFKILSYNVWFREDLELRHRMKAIGDLIQLHSPDLICFQEVTPDIYNIFCQSSWWKVYRCSVSRDVVEARGYFCMLLSKLPVKSFSSQPFRNSVMGRELCITEVEVLGGKPLIVATSHLESPCPSPPTWNQMFSKERVQQAKEAISILKSNPNVVFGGDMNWDDKLDGCFPIPDGWIDAWTELRPDEIGFTYDTKSNQMLSGNRSLQKRLDRFLCSLRDFKVTGIHMIGKEAIPCLSYVKEKKVRKEVKKLELPVLPSDHYGLLLTISSL